MNIPQTNVVTVSLGSTDVSGLQFDYLESAPSSGIVTRPQASADGATGTSFALSQQSLALTTPASQSPSVLSQLYTVDTGIPVSTVISLNTFDGRLGTGTACYFASQYFSSNAGTWWFNYQLYPFATVLPSEAISNITINIYK
jgi:hypothetical protein